MTDRAKWKPISQGLPKSGTCCWIFDTDMGVSLCTYSGFGDWVGDGYEEESGHVYKYRQVTHWMPATIPEEPA